MNTLVATVENPRQAFLSTTKFKISKAEIFFLCVSDDQNMLWIEQSL